jgi:hypothetical protein
MPLPSLVRRAATLSVFLGLSTSATVAAAQVETTPDLAAPAAPASAQPEPAEPAQPPAPTARATESSWYGWQVMIADAASIAMMGSGLAARNAPIGYLGLGGYLVAAPIVHGAHGRVGVGFASFGLRAGLPMVGAMLGYAAAGSCSREEQEKLLGCFFHGWGEAVAGGLVGAAGAVVIDAALLAHETRPIAQPREDGIPKVTSVSPSYDPRTRSAALGLGGTF